MTYCGNILTSPVIHIFSIFMLSLSQSSEKGNVLFLILIAVGLFAALSYAVTKSSSGGGNSISSEKAKTTAAAMIQFTNSIRNTITRLKLSNGCTENTLDFSNNVWKKFNDTPTIGTNVNAPSDKRCHLFDIAGGHLIPYIVPEDSIVVNTNPSPTSWREGHAGLSVYQIKGIGTDGAGNTTQELVIHVNRINLATCLELNNQLGVTNPNGLPPFPAPITEFSYSNGAFSGSGVYTSPEIDGKYAFCTGSGPAYAFKYALMER